MTITLPEDAPATVALVDKATGREVHRTETTVGDLRGTEIVLSYMFNALTVSGGVQWRNPSTGERYPHGLRIRTYVEHPGTGEVVEVGL